MNYFNKFSILTIFLLIFFLFLNCTLNNKREEIKNFKMIEIYDLDRNKINFDSNFPKGSITVLYFWNSWNQLCKDNLPIFNDLYLSLSDKVNFIMINLDSDIPYVKYYLRTNNVSFPTYYDLKSEWTKYYYVRYTPYCLIYDKNGKLLKEYKINDQTEYQNIKNFILMNLNY